MKPVTLFTKIDFTTTIVVSSVFVRKIWENTLTNTDPNLSADYCAFYVFVILQVYHHSFFNFFNLKDLCFKEKMYRVHTQKFIPVSFAFGNILNIVHFWLITPLYVNLLGFIYKI